MDIRGAPTLKQVVRMDNIPLAKAYYTEEGFLRDKPILTSTGIFEYRNADGSIRRELRLPEDVFAKESLNSFLGKPIVITHDAGLIDKDNVAENQIGTILSNGVRSGNDVRAEIIIHDTDEMKHSGLKELSLGYNLDLDETPGMWHGEKYDAIQRNIRINHLALVREARAGEQARLNLDGRDSNTLIGGKKMKKNPTKKTRRADGVLSPDELQKAIEEYKKRRNAESQTDADEEVEDLEIEEQMPAEETAPKKENPVEEDEDDTMELPDRKKVKDVEERVQFVKDRRDRRDEEGDPNDTEEAMGIIANQDEDIDYLFDIIDTLLAERDFGKETAKDAEDEPAEEEMPEDVEEDGDIDDLSKLKKNTATDADEEEMIDEEAEEELPEDEEEDADDVELEEEEMSEETEEDEDDVEEEEEEFDGCDSKRLNADSVDAIVRERIQIGIVGRQLNMDGLENKSIKSAKKAVIRKLRPSMNLDGKSAAYIDAAYDMCVKAVKRNAKKTVRDQKRKMFNKDSRSVAKKNVDSATAARERMIARYAKNN